MSSICAVLAETDVINMVSRGIPTADILKGIHLSMASRLAKLLKVTGITKGMALLTGGLALDEGLLAALREELVNEKITGLTAQNHPDSMGRPDPTYYVSTLLPSHGEEWNDQFAAQVDQRYVVPRETLDTMCKDSIAKAAELAKKVEAAEALKITAPDLLQLGIIDEIINEPVGGAHTDPAQAAALVDIALSRALADVGAMSVEARLNARYEKFRKMGSVGIIDG